MSDIEKNVNEEAMEDDSIIPLTDEETGETVYFQILAEADIDGKHYYALVPANEEVDEYIILEATEDGDDLLLDSIEDDDEFEKVEEYFNDLLFDEIDYDA